MVTPVSTSYTAATGVTIRGGRAAPSGNPAWMDAGVLNSWVAIPGTSGPESAGIMAVNDNGAYELNAYCGWVYVPWLKAFVVAAPGGHSDGTDNSVVALPMSQDVPRWVRLCEASVAPDATGLSPYNPDGKPKARHTYYSTLLDAARRRVLLVGARYYNANPQTSQVVDGFSTDTNTWDAAGTYPDIPVGPYGVVNDGNGDVWLWEGKNKLTLATKTLSTPTTGAVSFPPRFPWSLDTLRNELFGLCYGQGGGDSVFLGIVATRIKDNVHTSITFNPSAARDQFVADVPSQAAMHYDEANDRHLFYSGIDAAVGRIYVVTPNSGSVWDISFFPYAVGATMPVPTYAAGLNNKFTYVPEYKGFITMPDARNNVYYLKTSN